MFNKIQEINILLSDCNHLSETAYLYTEPKTKKEFVLKVEQKEEWDAFAINILEQEFRKLVFLSNEPEIATVNYLVSVDGDKIGYLMEYVKGKAFKDFLENNQFIEYDIAVNITKEILFALEKSHHLGISHGDLHEGNIMINDLGYVKLIDFLDMDSIGLRNNFQDDIDSLSKICESFFLKIESRNDQRRYLAIYNFIKSLTLLNGASKELSKIISVVDEFMYFDVFLFRIFSILSKEIDKGTLSCFLHFKTENKTLPISCLNIDTSIPNELLRNFILSNLRNEYKSKLFPLFSLNLIQEPIINVNNISQGNFTYDTLFLLTPKFIKYKKIIDKYNLFNIYTTTEDINRSIHDLVFLDLVNLLNEIPKGKNTSV